MATDTTSIQSDSVNAGSTIQEGDVDHGTLTQSGGTTSVQVPQGAEVVQIQVTPGETVQLPFPADGLVARLGDNGNLAVKVGDVTVILLGYAEAVGQGDIILLGSDGRQVDVAAVLASTDPNLDIQTAAGQGADQGAGVDNNGGLFSPFDPAAGIGGLNAVGGLDPTNLNYNLVNREFPELIEDDEVDTLPTLLNIRQGAVINEDDLHGNFEERASFKLAPDKDPDYQEQISDELAAELNIGDAQTGGTQGEGNDEFDLDDHEEESQNGNDPADEDNGQGVDTDREPLTSTAVVSVDFHNDVPGKISLQNGASVPLQTQLEAMNLTSHGHELQYKLLPAVADSLPGAGDGHGEVLVAYYITPGWYDAGEGDWQYGDIATIVFSVGVREPELATAPAEFNIDFTIYGVIDNVAGTSDADGDISEMFDIDVPFFMVDSDGSVTPSPADALTFHSVDDVPSLGTLDWQEVPGDGKGQTDYVLVINPTDTGIVHDETDGVQSGVGQQAGDPDSSKETAAEDDVPVQYQYEYNGQIYTYPNYAVFEALEAAGWVGNKPIGAAQTWLNVSFGADGRAGTWGGEGNDYVGNKEAGKTVFTGDGDANATAYQLYMGPAETPLTAGATNWTVMIDGVEVTVRAVQIDANTVIGIANKDDVDGDGVTDSAPDSKGSLQDGPDSKGSLLDEAVPSGDTPVFVLHLDPESGQLTMVQLHQINQGDPSNADDSTPALIVYGEGGAPTIVFEDHFNSLGGWTTLGDSNASIVGDIGTTGGQPDPDSQALLTPSEGGEGEDSNGNSAAEIEAFFGLSDGALSAIANDGDNANGSENATNGSAIRQVVNVSAGQVMTVQFNFLENESDSGEGGESPTYQDFGFIVVGDQVFRLSNVGDADLGSSASSGSFSWSEESGYLTFTFTFTQSGPVQIGFGVMNESDSAVDPGLLIDHLTITDTGAESINFRGTDFDGDHVDAPLVIQVQDDGPTVTYADTAVDTLTLDETERQGGDGIASVTADFADNFNAVGGFDYGTDGPGSAAYALQLQGTDVASGLFTLDPMAASGKGAEIVLNKVGNDIVGTSNGVEYFRISVDADGKVTFSQSNSIWHANTGNHDDSQTLNLSAADLLKIVQTLTDADGDSANGSINLGQGVFSIEDDGPKAVLSNAVADTLTVDETRRSGGDGVGSVTAEFADNFNQVAGFDYGADGAGSVAYALSLNGSNVASGLFAVDPMAALGKGAEILLNKVGNDIVGSVSGTEYFRISVDGDGTVTFSQTKNVWHDNTGDHDDSETLTLSSADLLKLVQTLTDADGDSDTAEINLGQGVFSIEDDGPRAVVSNATADKLTLDETSRSGGDGVASITAEFGDNFNHGSLDYGTDGAGSVAYVLNLNGSNVASGLFAVDPMAASGKGAEIVLNKVGNDIVGSVNGTEYFRISVDGDATVTFSQSNNVWHDDASNHDDPETLNLSSADLLKIVQTLTDADGDISQASINLGKGVFSIEDDGPKAVVSNAAADTLTLDETVRIGGDGIASITAAFADNFNQAAGFDMGTDGYGSVGYALTLGGSNVASGLFAVNPMAALGKGAEILLNKVGNDIVGSISGTEYFRISVDGNGTVTFSQSKNVWHDDTNNHDDSETLTLSSADLLKIVQTLTDADGDTSQAGINLGQGVFSIQDDGPVAHVSTQAAFSITLDESVGLDVNDPNATSDEPAPAGWLGSKTASAAGLFGAVDYGADGKGADPLYALILKNAGGAGTSIGTTNVATNLSVVDTGNLYANDQIVLVSESSYLVNGYVGTYDPQNPGQNVIAFSVRIDPATGDITVEQKLPIAHGTDGSSQPSHDDLATLIVTGQSGGGIFVSQTVTDGDGDKTSVTASAPIGVGFEDDGPKVTSVSNTLALDEDALGNGNAGGPGDDAGGASANFAVTVDFGSDGKAAAAFALTGAITATDANGQPLALAMAGTGSIQISVLQAEENGYPAGTVVGWAGPSQSDYAYWAFTVTINPQTGQGTFNLLKPLDHPATDDGKAGNGTETAWEDNIVLNIGVRATDGDGDFVDATVTVNVDDDTPIAVNDTLGSFVENSAEVDLGTVRDVLLTNDKGGADGIDLYGTGNVTLANGGVGSLGGKFTIVNINGVEHLFYKPVANVQDDAQETIQYTVVDKDGDATTATITTTVTDRGGGTADVSLALTAPGGYEDNQSTPVGQTGADLANDRLTLPFHLQITPTDAGDTVDSAVIGGIPSGANVHFGLLELPVSAGSITLVRGQDGGIYDSFLDALTGVGGTNINVTLAEHDSRDVTLSLNAVVDGVAVTPDDGAAIVDAVAAQPGLTDDSNQTKQETGGAGTSFTVNTVASFADIADGNEAQYVLIKNPDAGWSLGTVTIDGVTATPVPGGLAGYPGYTAFAVSSQADAADGSAGSVNVSFTVNGPGNVAVDTTKTIEIKAVAIDTEQGVGLDSTNNVAEATQTVDLKITDRTGGTDDVSFVGKGQGGYEDDEPTSQGQADVDEPADQTLSLTFNLKATATDPGDTVSEVIVGGIPSGATATWSDGNGHSLTFAAGSNTIMPTSGGTGDNASRAAFLADLIDGNGANIIVTLAEHDSRDVTLTMQSTIGGTQTAGDSAVAIVDAVAAQPAMDDYADTTYVESGAAKTFFTISAITTFADVDDGNEQQYVLIKNPGDGWVIEGATFTLQTGQIVPGGLPQYPGYTAFNVTGFLGGTNELTTVIVISGPGNVPADITKTIEIKAVAIDPAGDSDIESGNNIAEVTQTVDLTITDRTGGTDDVSFKGEGVGGYEDANATQPGQTSADPLNTQLQLTFNLKATANDPTDTVNQVVIGGIPSGATATWTDGVHTLTFGPGSTTVTPNSGGTGTDADRAAFLADLIDGTGADLKVTLAEHDSRDVVVSMQSTIGGTATTGDNATAIVDAVAAQPALVDPTNDSKQESGAAATNFTVTTTATFADIDDANEAQFVLVKNPDAGWSLGTVTIDGVPATAIVGGLAGYPGYTAFAVSSQADANDGSKGSVNLVIEVVGPGDVAATTTKSIEIRAVAIDTEEGVGLGAGNDKAEVIQTVDLTITDRTGGTDSVTLKTDPALGYEDANATSPGQTSADPLDTQLTLVFNLKVTPTDPTDAVDQAVIGGIPTGATATWTDGVHTLTFAAGSNIITPLSGGTENVSGARAAFLAALESAGGADIGVKLAEHDSRDVTLTMNSTVGGTLSGGDHTETAIVDAVAAQPSIDDAGDQSQAESGSTRTIFAFQTTATFADFADANETQYILIKNFGPGWTIDNVLVNLVEVWPAAVDGATIGYPGYTAYPVSSFVDDGTGSIGVIVAVGGPGNVAPGGSEQLVEIKSVAIDPAVDGDLTNANNVAEATQTVKFTVNDTAPTVSAVQSVIRVDEDGFAAGNKGVADDAIGDDVSTDSVTFNGTFAYTAAKDAIVDITLGTTGGLTGLTTLDNIAVKTVWDPATKTLTGFADSDNSGTLDNGERAVFTLVVTNVATGAYTFTLLEPVKHDAANGGQGANFEDDKSFSINIQVKDADGSLSNVGQATINIDDDTPEVTVLSTPTLTVDETTFGTPNMKSILGAFGGDFGADGEAAGGGVSYALTGANGAAIADGTLTSLTTLAGEPIALYNTAGGFYGKIVGGANDGVNVFKVNLSGTDVSLSQYLPLKHPDAGNPDDTVSILNQVYVTKTLTDGDGDSTSGSAPLALNFKDDGPAIDVAGVIPTLTVDESNFAADASADFSGLFPAVAGADGLGAPVAYSLGILIPGLPTNFFDVLEGNQILLVMNNQGEVEGRLYLTTDLNGLPTGPVAFTVSVDSAGVVTLDQNRAIIHPNDTNPDDAISLVANAIVLTASITDKDGDTASATAFIGDKLVFKDDGPTLTLVTPLEALTVDESNLAQNASVDITSLFNIQFGADGPLQISFNNSTPAKVFSLAVKSNILTETNLFDVASGQSIKLFQVDAHTIVGKIGVPNAPIFTITIDDNGVLTLDQHSAVKHPTTNPDEPVTMGLADLVTVTFTIRDGDKDLDSETLEIGDKFVFKDDGPSNSANNVSGVGIILDESNGTGSGNDGVNPGIIAAATVQSLFNASTFGNDGAGAVSYKLQAANNAATGLWLTGQSAPVDQILLVKISDTEYQGKVGGTGSVAFSIAINPLSGEVTVTQLLTLEHTQDGGPGAAHDDLASLAASIFVVQRVTDRDGDFSDAVSVNPLAIGFQDDGPRISLSGATVALTVDETNFYGSPDSADVAGLFLGIGFGADGAPVGGGIGYSLTNGSGLPVVDGTNTGLTDLLGNPIHLFNTAPGVIQGKVVGGVNDGVIVFQVSLNGSIVTLTQVWPIKHPNTANPDDAVSALGNLIHVTATVTDRDGDTAKATTATGLTLNFKDDGPSISLNGAMQTLTVDETVLSGNDTQSYAGLFTAAGGTDGTAGITYALGVKAAGVASGLVDVATGQPVLLSMNGSTVEGKTAGGLVVFTVTVDNAGNVTLDQIRPVVHPTTNPDESKTLSAADLVTLTATVTDKDGDTASVAAEIGTTLNFKDDGPSINLSGATQSLTVDETLLIGNDTQSYAGLFTGSYGTDAAGTLTYQLGIKASGAASGLVDTATGEAVQLFMNGTVVEGRISGGTVVFTVSVDGAGNVTLDQIRPVVHPTTDPDESKTLSAADLVTLTAVITDRDGDTSNVTAQIGTTLNFKDDGPTVSLSGSENTLTVDETVLGTDATQAFASAFTGSFKADGAGTVTYALGINAGASGLVDTASGETVQLFMSGATVEGRISGGVVVFTVSVDSAGNVTLDQKRAVVHPTTDPDEPKTLSADNLVTLTATITDKDGDSASSTLNIGQNLVFKDDGPSAVNDGTKVISALNGNATPELSFNVASGLLANDSKGADGAAISKVTFGGNDYTPVGGVITINVTGGVLVVNTDGSWTFNQTAMQPTATTHNFTYTLKDGDNDVSTATFAVTLKSQPLPLFNNAVALVDEDGLAGGANPHLTVAQGNGDDVGGKNSASEAIYNDTLTGLNWQGDVGTLTLSVTQAQLDHITLPDGTHPQLAHVTGQNTSHLVINNGSGQGVLDVTINPTTGAYSVTLLSAINNSISGSEDNVSLDITVKATNLGGATEGTLTVTIDEDLPVANEVGENTTGNAVLNTNLMLILDISGSMGWDSDLTGNGGSGALSKILAARAAVNELLEQYNSLGEVMVRIVTFSGSASEQGAVWMTLAQAKTFVNALLDNDGSTNYDDALIDAMGAFPDSGRLGDGTGGTVEPANGAPIQNVSYFISDGQPNEQTNFPGVDYGGSGNASGIQPVEETAWINFLKQYDIKSYAIGVDPNFATETSWQNALKPIAYDGAAETNDDANLVITLSDFGDLAQELIGTVPSINASLVLNGNSFGADGGFVKSLTFANGTTLTYNPTTNTVTSSGPGVTTAWDALNRVLAVTLTEGVLVMNLMTSVYTFTPDPALGSVVTVPVDFVLSDNDGDLAGNTLTLGVSPVDYAPIARDDAMIIADGHGSGFAVDDRWLLWNDSDADGDALTIPGTITINADNAGSFTYTAEGGGQSDTGDVKYDDVSGSNLNGNGLDNIIIGDSSNEALKGFEGNDVLVGGAGNDSLEGGEGNDLLMGGTGNDNYVLGAGDGKDLIVEESGSADIVTLSGVTLGQVALSQVGNNLKITYGTDVVTVEDHFSNPDKAIEFVNIGGTTYVVSGTSLVPMVAPNTNAGSGSGNADAASSAVNLSGTDDGTVVSFRITSLPSNGTLYKDAALTQVIAANDLVTATGNAATVYFKPNANYNGTPTFQYASVDNLGLQDGSPATATITVTADAAVTANNDTVVTAVNNGPAFLLSQAALLRNDVAGADGPAAISSVAESTNNLENMAINGSNINIDTTNQFDPGDSTSFTYTADDGSSNSSDTATVSLVAVADSNIDRSSSSGAEIIFDSDTGHAVTGGSGNDTIYGNGGNDTLNGGGGTDWLFGGAGSDTMIYGANDKFDGGANFDRVQSTASTFTYNSTNFTSVEMLDLGDTDHNSNRTVVINAADVLDTNITTIGGHAVDLFVIGDSSGANARDNVDLNGFNMSPVATNVAYNDGTFGNHTYNIYVSATDPAIKVAVEVGLDVV